MSLIDFKKQDGLVPVIVQEYRTNDVLMLAYMNEEAFKKTIETGNAHYWSRSRGKLWLKGEESGNIQRVKEIFLDCDSDTLLIKVDQVGGAACHKGYRSCFFRHVKSLNDASIIGERVFDPRERYKGKREL